MELTPSAIGRGVSGAGTSAEEQLKLVFGENRQGQGRPQNDAFGAGARNERLALIENTAALFAHEVANPLNGLSLSLQLMLADLARRELDIPSLQETVRRALREVGCLVELLDEFRSVAPVRMLNLKPTDLEKMIREIVALENAAYRNAGVAVRLDVERGLPAIELDASKTKHAVFNLCKNAADAMTRGGCLTIKAYRSERMVVLEITDDGSGVPEDLDVFEVFETTKSGRTGLGLAVAQQVISAHHGTLDYRSNGSGTTCTVRLPIRNPDAISGSLEKKQNDVHHWR